MTTEINIQEMAARLESLEIKLNLLSNKLETQPSTSDAPLFEYVVFADEQEVWRGQKLYEQFPEIIYKYPNVQISILWQPEQPFVWV